VSLCGDRLRRFFSPFPRQEVIDPIDRVIGDAGDDVGEPGFGFDVVEARGFDECVDDRGAAT
jgi:hypothetical protein